MRVLTPARRHADRQPSWDAIRSVVASLPAKAEVA